MARSTVSPEIKAAALADLAAGETPATVAQRYGLDRAVVKMWKARHVTDIVTNHVTGSVTAPVRYPALEERQAVIVDTMYRLLEAKLKASERLAEHLTTEYLARQGAEGLAELGDYLDRTSLNLLALLAARRTDPE